MRGFFHLEENGTSVSKEAVAGVTSFFAMMYIVLVVPSILSQSGMEWGAVFLATVIASVAGTLVMALVANTPFVLAPGLGMATFFAVTACATMGFTWQQALSVVFICGLINVLITVTRVRRIIVSAIPRSLQLSIGAGIGVYVGAIGITQSGLLGPGAFSSEALPGLAVFFVSLLLAAILQYKHVHGGIIIAMVVASVLAFLIGVTHPGDSVSLSDALSQLPTTFCAIFTPEGIPSLFDGTGTVLASIALIMMFSFVDTFDTVGTFMGVGRQSGIFTEEEMGVVEHAGFKTRLDRALVADSVATSVGAVFGTSNTTTVIESVAGVANGGRTGLTSLFTAVCLALCVFFTPLISMVPGQSTAGILVLVGVMMLSPLREIDWHDLSEAAPAVLAMAVMGVTINISYGIATAFIAYCVVKTVKGQMKDVHPALWVASAVFLVAALMTKVF